MTMTPRPTRDDPEQRRRLSGASAGAIVALLIAMAVSVAAQPPARHAMSGMVLGRSVLISHDSVPGIMPAMTRPFDVRDTDESNGLVPGAVVSFTLVLGREAAHIERVKVVRYESAFSRVVRENSVYCRVGYYSTGDERDSGFRNGDVRVRHFTKAPLTMSDLPPGGSTHRRERSMTRTDARGTRAAPC